MIWKEKLEYSELVRKNAALRGFDFFCKNIENPCLDPKYGCDIIRNRKNTSKICLDNAVWNIDSEEKKMNFPF